MSLSNKLKQTLLVVTCASFIGGCSSDAPRFKDCSFKTSETGYSVGIKIEDSDCNIRNVVLGVWDSKRSNIYFMNIPWHAGEIPHYFKGKKDVAFINDCGFQLYGENCFGETGNLELYLNIKVEDGERNLLTKTIKLE